jgi:tetratricopeptide (TPR) repeat protein
MATLADLLPSGDGGAIVAEDLRRAVEEGTEADLERAFEALPAKAKAEAAELLRFQGNERFQKKDFRDAVTLYTQALHAAPTDKNVLANLAACHLALGDHTAALEAASRCVQHHPLCTKAHFRMGCALEHLQQEAAAAACFERALALEPHSTQVMERLSTVRSVLRQHRAAQHLAQAMESGE